MVLNDQRVLAVVPARAGSVGVQDKNMRELHGLSLIALAARTLQGCPWIDARVLSTDSERYATEGEQHGLTVPGLRPPELSTSEARGIDAFRHAVVTSEGALGETFDVVLLIEPTSPFRRASDIEEACNLLLTSGAGSVVTVSPIEGRSHPWKLLTIDDTGQLGFYVPEGRSVVNRQELPGGLYYRNGICYAARRPFVFEHDSLIAASTLALTIERPVVNIDDEVDLAVAEVLLGRFEDVP